jgi:uncharacterized protein (TIGR02266 family)
MTMKRAGRENRRTPRVEVSKGVWVAWRTDGSPSVSRVRDLSAGGAFISTNAPLAQGSAIQLLFSLPEGEVRIEGVVRYSNSGKGMGVEFTRMGVADRARLQELIRRLNS